MNPRPAARLAVVVVSFQTRDVLEPCLRSIVARVARRASGCRQRVDRRQHRARGARRFRKPSSSPTSATAGTVAPRTRESLRCTAPAVLLLNSDTVLAPGALDALGRYLDDHPNAAVVGPAARELRRQPAAVDVSGSRRSPTCSWGHRPAPGRATHPRRARALPAHVVARRGARGAVGARSGARAAAGAVRRRRRVRRGVLHVLGGGRPLPPPGRPGVRDPLRAGDHRDRTSAR